MKKELTEKEPFRIMQDRINHLTRNELNEEQIKQIASDLRVLSFALKKRPFAICEEDVWTVDTNEFLTNVII